MTKLLKRIYGHSKSEICLPTKQMSKTMHFCRKAVVTLLFAIVLIANFCRILPAPAYAGSRVTTLASGYTIGTTIPSKQALLNQAKQVLNSAENEFGKLLSETEIREQVEASLARIRDSAENEFGKLLSETAIREQVEASLVRVGDELSKIATDKKLIAHARGALNLSSDRFCAAYSDSLQGIDNSAWNATLESVNAMWMIANAITSASIAGAGSLSGYAGIASVVAQMGLGDVVTTIAGLMGSQVAGAAATSVVTATVGGPAVMGAILAGGVGVTAYGTYELAKFTTEKFTTWAGDYCSTIGQLTM